MFLFTPNLHIFRSMMSNRDCSRLPNQTRESVLHQSLQKRREWRDCFSPFSPLCLPLYFSQDTSSSTSLTSSSVPIYCSPISFHCFEDCTSEVLRIRRWDMHFYKGVFQVYSHRKVPFSSKSLMEAATSVPALAPLLRFLYLTKQSRRKVLKTNKVLLVGS